MSCPWQSEIALLAGGDCAPTENLHQHLADCAHCRVLYADLQQLRDALAAPAPAMTVHARVMAELRSTPRRHLPWPALAAAAAVLLLVAVTAVLQMTGGASRPARKSAAAPVPVSPRAPEQSPRLVTATRTTEAAPKRIREPHSPSPRVAASPQTAPAEAPVLRLVTDDPDVIIYLVAD